jgi:hypothetical protein
MMRWNSITKKLISCSASPSMFSRDWRGIIKYFRGRKELTMPWLTVSLPTNSEAEMTATVIRFELLAQVGCKLTSKTNVQGLKGPAKDWQVATSEDRSRQHDVGNSSGTRVFPLENVSMVPSGTTADVHSTNCRRGNGSLD